MHVNFVAIYVDEKYKPSRSANFDRGNFDGFDESLRSKLSRNFYINFSYKKWQYLSISGNYPEELLIQHLFIKCYSKKKVPLHELPNPSRSLFKDMPSSSVAGNCCC